MQERRILVRHSAGQRGAQPAGQFKHELFQQCTASAMRGNPPALQHRPMLRCASMEAGAAGPVPLPEPMYARRGRPGTDT
ncbi:hypothetical protein D9X30_0310 [Cupriavidus sp. U2]|nr:hypothetical protein D9X30_0310 [Cupriavidus sp. U2]